MKAYKCRRILINVTTDQQILPDLDPDPTNYQDPKTLNQTRNCCFLLIDLSCKKHCCYYPSKKFKLTFKNDKQKQVILCP